MPTVQLSDIYNATVYQDLAPVDSPEKTAFFQSGVATRDASLDGLAATEGKTIELPFWNDLDASVEPNYSSDDPAVSADPQKVAQGDQLARKAFLNQGYSAMDLTRELQLGDDALQHIRNRFGTYWMRNWQRRLIAAAQGVMADNVANDDGDMVHDIASESIAGQGADTLFSRSAFINAAYSMGDMVDGITAMAVHSSILQQMAEQGGVEDVRDAEGVLIERTYMGRSLIVDDSLPAIAGSTDGLKYVSILFGAGAFGWGEASPVVPSEIDRSPRSGNGGGQEEIWERKTWLLHPAGFQNTGTPAADSFTLAELAAAAAWDRVVDRKNVPMAFLITN